MIDGVRAIFLDWGGTLVHVSRQEPTRIKSVQACLAYLRNLDIKVTTQSADDLMQRFCSAVAEKRAPDDLAEFDSRQTLDEWRTANRIHFPVEFDWQACIEQTWRPWIGCLDPIGDITATLSKLRRCGFVLGLVSNCATPRSVAQIELERLGILNLLSFTLFSSELGLRKPHPRIYESAIERLREVASEVAVDQIVFVGDTPAADIDGPARCGMLTALVKTGNASGDLDELSTPPTFICDSIHDLPNLLSDAHDRPVDTKIPPKGAS